MFTMFSAHLKYTATIFGNCLTTHSAAICQIHSGPRELHQLGHCMEDKYGMRVR
jgi:hypothetical protein